MNKKIVQKKNKKSNIKITGRNRKSGSNEVFSEKAGVSFLYALVLFIVLICMIVSFTAEKYDQPEAITDPFSETTEQNIETTNSKETTDGAESTSSQGGTTSNTTNGAVSSDTATNNN